MKHCEPIGIYAAEKFPLLLNILKLRHVKIPFEKPEEYAYKETGIPATELKFTSNLDSPSSHAHQEHLEPLVRILKGYGLDSTIDTDTSYHNFVTFRLNVSGDNFQQRMKAALKQAIHNNTERLAGELPKQVLEGEEGLSVKAILADASVQDAATILLAINSATERALYSAHGSRASEEAMRRVRTGMDSRSPSS